MTLFDYIERGDKMYAVSIFILNQLPLKRTTSPHEIEKYRDYSGYLLVENATLGRSGFWKQNGTFVNLYSRITHKYEDFPFLQADNFKDGVAKVWFTSDSFNILTRKEQFLPFAFEEFLKNVLNDCDFCRIKGTNYIINGAKLIPLKIQRKGYVASEDVYYDYKSHPINHIQLINRLFLEHRLSLYIIGKVIQV